jgi:hypothetical protein
MPGLGQVCQGYGRRATLSIWTTPFFIDRVEDEVPPGPQAPGTVGDLGAVGDKYASGRGARGPARSARRMIQVWATGRRT